jgi:hypothetical protein
MATWVLDIFQKFYLVKNHKIANNSTTTKTIEKMRSFGFRNRYTLVLRFLQRLFNYLTKKNLSKFTIP